MKVECPEFLSPEQWSQKPEDLEKYGKDWTTQKTPQPGGVVFPKSTEDVKNIVLWARKHQFKLVPSGGRTGLSGGAMASDHEMVISFEKMNQVISFDEMDGTLTVQAGMITEDLQNLAKEKGYFYPVDFAARGSSHIGGNVATNAGGIKVLRYGLTRQWVAGLTVVTGTGEVLMLNKSLIKNASGYDLRHLFIGSEGTLGFITEVSVFLTQPPQEPFVLLLGVEELTSVTPIFNLFRKMPELLAFEIFTDIALKYVKKSSGLASPMETQPQYYLVVEIEKKSEQVLDVAMDLLEQAMEKGWVSDGVISQSPQQAKEFWRLREDISEATAPHTPYKNDVSVTISHIPAFLKEVDETLKLEYPHFEVVWFGHIGDGNLHINILKPQDLSKGEFLKSCRKVDQILFEKIQKFSGSVSAEHGVGITKKPYLHYTRSEEEIRLMKEIKKVFDPDGLINPGKIF